MTREAVNKAISIARGWHSHTCTRCAARGDRDYVEGPLPGYNREVTADDYPDWHSDELWPVLLLEMPMPHIWKNPDGTWYCDPATAEDNVDMEMIVEHDFTSPAEAVCGIWLAWHAFKTAQAERILVDDTKGKCVPNVPQENSTENE